MPSKFHNSHPAKPAKLPLLKPAEMLKVEFLEPLKITPYRLAKDINVPLTRITAILNDDRAITPDTGLRLDRYFGLSEGWWFAVQTHCDIREAQRRFGPAIRREVTPREEILCAGT